MLLSPGAVSTISGLSFMSSGSVVCGAWLAHVDRPQTSIDTGCAFLESAIHSYKNLYTTSENFTEGDNLPDVEASITIIDQASFDRTGQAIEVPLCNFPMR